MTRVLIADDHPYIIAGLKSVLADTEYQVVGTAANGLEALEALPAARPDILILDVSMPQHSGLDVLRTLRSRGDHRPVILLTASLKDSLLLEALDLDVQGIVLKEGAQHLLLRCLDAVRQKGRWIDQALLQKALDLKLRGNGGDNSALGKLTPRERAIVGLLAQGRRNREIGAELGITEGTVKVYLHRIYEELGVSNRTELAILARNAEA